MVEAAIKCYKLESHKHETQSRDTGQRSTVINTAQPKAWPAFRTGIKRNLT